MPYVDAAGARLYFEEYGEGYPIIFIHELGSDLRQWEDQVRYFSRAYRCITYNARGYVPSDVPEDPAAYGWEQSIDDIAAIMLGLSIDCAHLLGLSMGAYTGLHFALRYPRKISAVVSAAAGSGSPPSQRHSWLRETSILARGFERGTGSIAEKVANSSTRIQLKYKDPKRWQTFASQLREQSGRGLSNTVIRCQGLRPSLHDMRDRFAKMTVPVLLIVGDEDSHCLETNLMLKSTLPNAGLWISPNTGHSINLEEPAAFNIQVEGFLNAVERGSWRRGYPTNGHRASSRNPELRLLTYSSTDVGEGTVEAKVVPLRQEQPPL